MNNYAYFTLLCTNNYLYGCIGLIYSGKKTNPKYPFYCIVTENITEENVSILEKIGYNVIKEKEYIPALYMKTLKQLEDEGIAERASSDVLKNGWQHAGTKFLLFKQIQFDKILYIDADSYIIQNLDDVFEKEGGSHLANYYSRFIQKPEFGGAFFLIQPNIETFNKLNDFVEHNATYVHPVTHKVCLYNDAEVLRDVCTEWQTAHFELPLYLYVDILHLIDDEDHRDYGINNYYKIRGIHLSDTKPWLAGSNYVKNFEDPYIFYKKIYLTYIYFLNQCLLDIHNKGIAELAPVQ